MKHQMDLVQEFHEVMQVHTPIRPTMPSPEVHNLRFRLIDEEAQELVESTNLIQYLDAIGDLLYVVNGAALAAGFTPAQVAALRGEAGKPQLTAADLVPPAATTPPTSPPANKEPAPAKYDDLRPASDLPKWLAAAVVFAGTLTFILRKLRSKDL